MIPTKFNPLGRNGNAQPANEVWYWADAQITPSSTTNIVSHTFADGKGVIQFSGTALQGWFSGTAVTKVAIPSGILSGNMIFFNCTTLVEVVLHTSGCALMANGFQNCSNLENLTNFNWNALTSIPQTCFANCKKLAIPQLNDNITSIGTTAFQSCAALVGDHLPPLLTTIGNNTFNGCTGLQLSALPSGLTTIGSYALNNVNIAASLEIPAGVTSISANAFAVYNTAQRLTTVRFLGTPTSIDANAFIRRTAITDIYVPWAEGAVANAPWGATNATVHYES